MPEHIKTSLGASPVARAGGGDISERELSRERYTMQTTPPARLQPAHPKKQLFFTPVNKFTTSASRTVTSTNLARIRSCLDEYRRPARPVKVTPKASSMEDLTPTRRVRREKKAAESLAVIFSPKTLAEQQAASKIGRFMLVHAWRRRRDEVRCLKKTLTFQVTCSERLRIQVCTLKSLLDSDNAKVRLAMRELERLKQLLHDRDLEKQVLEREKLALENDVACAEDKASEMSIGWRNCRNELEGARNQLMSCEHQLSVEKSISSDLRAQKDDAILQLSKLEGNLSNTKNLLLSADDKVTYLKRDVELKQTTIDKLKKMVKAEKQSLESKSLMIVILEQRVSASEEEKEILRVSLCTANTECARLSAELAETRRQLDWWPRPLTRMMGIARSWLRSPISVSDAVVWSMVPARHGC